MQTAGVVLVPLCLGVVGRRRFDRFTREVDVDARLRPADRADPVGGDHDLAAGQPVARIDDQIVDAPSKIFEEQVVDVAAAAVCRDGFLVVRLPKRAQAAENRSIPISE